MKLKQTCLSLGIALGMLAGITYPTLAQINNNEGFQTNESSSVFGGSSFGNSFNPLNLIHNANLNGGRNTQEFYQESETQIEDAAAQFKLQRQKLLLNPAPSSVVSPSSSQKTEK